MFGDGAHLLIDLVEQCRDKIEGDHGLLRSWQGVTLSTSVEEVHDHDNKIIKCYRIIGLSKTNTIGYYAITRSPGALLGGGSSLGGFSTTAIVLVVNIEKKPLVRPMPKARTSPSFSRRK
jgi:hypothetical protein